MTPVSPAKQISGRAESSRMQPAVQPAVQPNAGNGVEQSAGSFPSGFVRSVTPVRHTPETIPMQPVAQSSAGNGAQQARSANPVNQIDRRPERSPIQTAGNGAEVSPSGIARSQQFSDIPGSKLSGMPVRLLSSNATRAAPAPCPFETGPAVRAAAMSSRACPGTPLRLQSGRLLDKSSGGGHMGCSGR